MFDYMDLYDEIDFWHIETEENQKYHDYLIEQTKKNPSGGRDCE